MKYNRFMSYKFDSLIRILYMLDRGKHVTLASLVDSLEVTERTIYRYIKTLRDAGFPIDFNQGAKKYAFVEGFSLRKPNLTLEESLALSLAKKQLDSLGRGFLSSLEALENKIMDSHPTLPKHILMKLGSTPDGSDKYVMPIHRACMDYQRLNIKYKSLYQREVTERTVDPYYLFYHDNFWNFRGYCHLREEFRSFALDRISSLEVLDEHFLPKRISSEDDLSSAFGVVFDKPLVDIVLRFDEEAAEYITRRKWHKSQEEKRLPDGSLEVRFKVNGLSEIKKWIYRWIPHVTVVYPKELIEEITKELDKALMAFKQL